MSTHVDQHYHSTISGRGALLPETKIILREIGVGQTLADVRRAVIEGNLTDRNTRQTRENVWKMAFLRYISERDWGHVATLASLVAHCPNTAAVDLTLFYEYCQADLLLHDMTVDCLYNLYHNARVTVGATDLDEWLKLQETPHPEIAAWSLTTRNRIIKSYLATIRDFGLVTGIDQKEFHKLYVPREAFVYALYHQKDRGVEGKALVHSTDWRLFLLNERDVILMLDDAAKGGFIHFRYAGDVYDLRFIYANLSEVVHAITGG